MKSFARRNRLQGAATHMWANLFRPVSILLLALAVLVSPALLEAQEAGKVRWIGVLRITPDLAWMEALRAGLRELGYVEGQQIGIIDRLAEEKSHRLPDLAGELARRQVKVLPILLEKCEIPPFLKGKLYADFTDQFSYDPSFAKLLHALGVDPSNVTGASLYDPFSPTYGRQRFLAVRPQTWHCIFCGWRCNESFNDYLCKSCQRIRPFAGGSATMVGCRKCKQFSLGIAVFCEWCGSGIGHDA